MQKEALVIIDIQNDITKNYKDVIGNINKAIDWAINNNIHVIYIRHENLSAKANGLKPYIHFPHLLSHMPNKDFKNDPVKLESLLPWSADLPEDCRLPADSAKNTQED